MTVEEMKKIKKYKETTHSNFIHWKNAKRWVLVANIRKNPNDIKSVIFITPIIIIYK